MARIFLLVGYCSFKINVRDFFSLRTFCKAADRSGDRGRARNATVTDQMFQHEAGPVFRRCTVWGMCSGRIVTCVLLPSEKKNVDFIHFLYRRVCVEKLLDDSFDKANIQSVDRREKMFLLK